MSPLIRISLVFIYLVIIAGSVVRMTGSGMGCPDWPKCFGHLIPPTEQSQIEWQAHYPFKKGQIIIHNASLQVAQKDFVSDDHFNASYWETYTKHNYAKFNVFHTWTEYFNRLVGALSGIPILLLCVFTIAQWRKNKALPILALCSLFMLGFEAWLGKLVVDGNLIPGSITIHMLGALVIIALLCSMLGMANKYKLTTVKYTTLFKNLLIVSMLLTLFQIALGTQVREQIDIMNHNGIARNEWISLLDIKFYIHRSFSIAILMINLWLWYVNQKRKLGFIEMPIIMLMIILEIIAGIVLNYLEVPTIAQPIHLLISTILFGYQFYAIVRYTLSHRVKIITLS